MIAPVLRQSRQNASSATATSKQGVQKCVSIVFSLITMTKWKKFVRPTLHARRKCLKNALSAKTRPLGMEGRAASDVTTKLVV